MFDGVSGCCEFGVGGRVEVLCFCFGRDWCDEVAQSCAPRRLFRRADRNCCPLLPRARLVVAVAAPHSRKTLAVLKHYTKTLRLGAAGERRTCQC